MPDLSIQRTSQTEIRLAHPFLGGWIFAAIGVGVAWAGTAFINDGVGRWLMAGMGALFALIGIGGGLWRYELTFDLMARSYRGRRGFWPSPQGLQGSVDELEGVALTRSWRRGDDTGHAVWVVHLSFRSQQKPVSVFETTDEATGYRKMEELARLLHVSAIDRTGDTKVVRGHDELDRSVADTVRSNTDLATFSSPSRITEPPPGSGIELDLGDLGGTMIVLPAAGIQAGTVALAVFALPFLGFGVLALTSVAGVSPVDVQGTLSSKWIVGLVFTLVGLLLEVGAIFSAVAREVIRDEGDALVISLRAFGKHYRRKKLIKRDIEEIAVKDGGSSRTSGSSKKPLPTEVVLRTDQNVVRIAGGQPTDRQRWLADSLLRLARRV